MNRVALIRATTQVHAYVVQDDGYYLSRVSPHTQEVIQADVEPSDITPPGEDGVRGLVVWHPSAKGHHGFPGWEVQAVNRVGEWATDFMVGGPDEVAKAVTAAARLLLTEGEQ